MDRDLLLGLSATLNVACAELASAGLYRAANSLNAAVVEIHRRARWSEEDLSRMAAAQAWLATTLALSTDIASVRVRMVVE